jgi:hypothetical protein
MFGAFKKQNWGVALVAINLTEGNGPVSLSTNGIDNKKTAVFRHRPVDSSPAGCPKSDILLVGVNKLHGSNINAGRKPRSFERSTNNHPIPGRLVSEGKW